MSFLSRKLASSDGDDGEVAESPSFTTLEFWMQFPNGAIRFSIGCLVGLIMLLAFYLVVTIVLRLLRAAMSKSHLSKDVVDMTVAATKIFMWVQLAPIVIGSTGLPMNSIITVLGAIVLSVGMALKPAVENFVAGALLAYLNPFDHGHVVSIAGGMSGVVRDIHMAFTKLVDPCGNTIYVPNTRTYLSPIHNHTREGRVRIDTEFPLAVTTSTSTLQKARRAMLNALAKVDKVLKDPCPSMVVKHITEVSVVVAARTWVLPQDYFVAQVVVNEAVREALLAEGVKFASRFESGICGGDDSDYGIEDAIGSKADEDAEEGAVAAAGAQITI